jgi:hypothetical protein
MNPNHVAILMIVAIGAAYFVFLWASWQEFQKDRAMRDTKIDELLERLPKPKTEPVVES